MQGRTGEGRCQDARTGAESLSQAARNVEELSRAGPQVVTPDELNKQQDALLRVTAAGSQLARVLDTLANQYQTHVVEQTSDVYIALDQAAAAAEDLANCARLAASALADEE